MSEEESARYTPGQTWLVCPVLIVVAGWVLTHNPSDLLLWAALAMLAVGVVGTLVWLALSGFVEGILRWRAPEAEP